MMNVLLTDGCKTLLTNHMIEARGLGVKSVEASVGGHIVARSGDIAAWRDCDYFSQSTVRMEEPEKTERPSEPRQAAAFLRLASRRASTRATCASIAG
jgi:hypothetical protein